MLPVAPSVARLATSTWPADQSSPVLETTVGDVLRDAARLAPDQPALVAAWPDESGRRRWSFAELLDHSERTARALLARFQPGERVAVWAPNGPEWLLLEFGAALAGVTLVTVNPAYRASELTFVLKQSRANGIFLVPEYRGNPMVDTLDQVKSALPDLREVLLFSDWKMFCAGGSARQRLPDVKPEDAVQIEYTSGTTGFPKGALLHHRGITNNGRFWAQRQRVSAGDVLVNPLQLFHIASCGLFTLGAVQALATQVLMPYFDAALQLGLIGAEGGTVLVGAPTMLIAILEHPDLARRSLSSLRSAVCGAATVPPELVRRVEAALNIPLSITFGQTEASGTITQTHLDDTPADRANTIGQPLPRTEVKIVDPVSGETVPTGVVGELCTRGYHVMRGYFDNPEATAAAIDPDGWLHTGDLCSMDQRGYCYIEGRLKEMIIRGGENIYPREIEQLLSTHPGVADVAVVGVPDSKWGEQVAAFVRPAAKHSPSSDELVAFCRAHLAAHKTPRYWVFVDQFPMTPSGKIQKFRLREQFITPL